VEEKNKKNIYPHTKNFVQSVKLFAFRYFNNQSDLHKRHFGVGVKRFILVIFLCLFIFSSPLTTPRAHALWPDIPGFTYKQMLEDIRDRIKGIILGMLKQQAIQTINKQVDSMMAGGGKGGPKFITDWEAYLYKTPDNNTKLYINDYLSKITSGKGSISGYKSEGFGAGGGGYASQLVAMAKSNTINKKTPSLTYQGDPSQMFASGKFKNFNSYLSGINNPWSFDVNAQNEFAKKTAMERKMASVKSQAYLGGIGVGEAANGKGKITLPGSVIVQTKANSMDLGNKVIASATHPEEVITALVSKLLSQAMKQGISMVSSKLGVNVGGLIGGLNPSSFFGSTSSSSSVLSGSSNSGFDSLKTDPLYYQYVGGNTSSGSMNSTFDQANAANQASGATSTTRINSSIPPPQRNF
jgi:hypothetical protein